MILKHHTSNIFVTVTTASLPFAFTSLDCNSRRIDSYVHMMPTAVHNGRNFGNFCLNYVERIVELVTLSVRQSTETVVMCHSSSVLLPTRQGGNGVASCSQLPTTTDDTNHTKARCANVPLWKTERYRDKFSFIHLFAPQKRVRRDTEKFGRRELKCAR